MILHERRGTMQDTLSEIVEIIKANAISVYSRHGQRWRRPTVDSQTAHRPRSFVILIMRPLLRKYREIPYRGCYVGKFARRKYLREIVQFLRDLINLLTTLALIDT